VRRKTRNVGIYVILLIFAFFFLLPVYMLLATSFKPLVEIGMGTMWLLPKQPSLEGFTDSIQRLSPNLWNSFLLVIPATIFSCLLGSINGYIFSKIRFPGINLLFLFVLFGMFIPYQSILFPLIQFLQKTQLYGTIWGLIITHVIYGLPITSLIFRNYYMEVPDEMLEAAGIDGAGLFKSYFLILFPLSIPGFVVAVIWQFTNIWNEFLFAVTITSDPKKQPITVALVNLAGSQMIQWNLQMAGAIVAAIPTLLVYIFLGKYFIRGLMSGSVKG